MQCCNSTWTPLVWADGTGADIPRSTIRFPADCRPLVDGADADENPTTDLV